LEFGRGGAFRAKIKKSLNLKWNFQRGRGIERLNHYGGVWILIFWNKKM